MSRLPLHAALLLAGLSLSGGPAWACAMRVSPKIAQADLHDLMAEVDLVAQIPAAAPVLPTDSVEPVEVPISPPAAHVPALPVAAPPVPPTTAADAPPQT